MSEVDKWTWKMVYCEEKGLPPAQAWAWNIAENAYHLTVGDMT